MRPEIEKRSLTAPVVILYKSANRPADATARVVHELARQLAEAGFSTVVHGMDNNRHPHRPRPRGGGPLAQVRYGMGKVADQLAEARFLVQTALELARVPDEDQVVISVDYPTGIGLTPQVARLLGRKRVRIVSWVMDDYQDQKLQRAPYALEARVRRFVDRLAMRMADEVVTIGACMADRIRTTTGREATVIRVWAHEPSGEPDVAAVSRVRNSWGVGEQTAVLYSGHAAPHHPLESLVDAAEKLNGESDLEFVVSGVGLELERLRRSPRAASLAHWRFGQQVPSEEVDALLAAGDVHVVSLAESVTGTCVPSKTYTALVRGKPVLYLGSPDGQAARDIVEAGAGFVVPTDDVEGVRAALVCLRDVETRVRMGEAGRAWAKLNCELEPVVANWVALVRGWLPAFATTRRTN